MNETPPPPRFSVLVPCYNRPEYVSQAVASVLASTYSDFELIVSDNCSPRQSEIIAALAPFKNDRRFTLVTQKENLGEARNRHFLMERASGLHRIILADDDMLAPHALATLREVIDRQPGYDMYLFGYTVVDEDGRIFETRRALQPLELSLRNPRTMQDVLCSDTFPYWFYHPATFCFPASLHRDIVPNHNIGIGDDLMFIFDALLAGKRALVIPESLFDYRRFMGPRTYSQPNQSLGRFANIRTRRHMFYNLHSRETLPRPFDRFVRSRRYRQRFVYDAIITDRHASPADLNSFDLTPGHLHEVRQYWRFRPKALYGRWLKFKRFAAYTRYFGLRALIEAWQVSSQRRAYRAAVAKIVATR